MIEGIAEKRLHVFGSACHLLTGPAATDCPNPLDLALAELDRLETRYASFRPGSLIDQINRAAGTGSFVALDAESRSLFTYVTALWDQSNHLFDPTCLVLANCYDAHGKLLVTSDRLQEALALADWSKLEVDSRGARLCAEGMEINLDSCIRPYAVDAVRKLLLRHGVRHALIEMDQDAACIGRQPDGANWLVGLRYPRGPRTVLTRLKFNDRGFAMRGNFEQCLHIGGENFGRALSPVDAQPIPGLLSVAVIAENCLTACSAASIARLKTEQAGIRWLEKLGLPWLAIDRQLNCLGPLAPA